MDAFTYMASTATNYEHNSIHFASQPVEFNYLNTQNGSEILNFVLETISKKLDLDYHIEENNWFYFIKPGNDNLRGIHDALRQAVRMTMMFLKDKDNSIKIIKY